MEKEFKTAEDVQKWLSEDRNVPASVTVAVASTLFEGGCVYPSSLLNIQREDLGSLGISPPRRNVLFNKLQQQQQQPPLTKRQRELRKWGELQISVKSPTEVPLPELIEELPPPAFVAPKGWLDDLCEEVKVQFNRQDSENPRVSPVAVVRCSRGGKTRALHELAWALPLILQKDNETGTAIIYVSFNGQTPLSPWEKSRPLEALYRRILYTALRGKPNQRAFNSFAASTVFEKEDVTDWLGNAKCILLIDELNLLEATMNEDFAIFLKDTFLMNTGRALVFSSHVVSVNNKLTSYMHSQSEREVKIKKLPLVRNLFQARDLLGYAALSPHLVLYLGLIPALCYVAMQNSLPHQRREDAIQKYVDTGVSSEKVETLLMTMLTGEYTLVPEMFRELMDIDVIENKPIALWIPCHMTQVLLTLSRLPALPVALRRCLGAIYEQFESLRTQKIQSGDGWEALFIVTLLTRCLTKSFCELVPLYGFDCEVCWNEPFDTQVDFGCESVEEFVSGIPFRRSAKSISIYFPTNAKFEIYDVILACWGDNLQRQLFGYQLKVGSKLPEAFAMEDLFIRSYLIRGLPMTKESSIRRWTSPSDVTLDKFFGVSAQNWSPKRWAKLRNSAKCKSTTGEEVPKI